MGTKNNPGKYDCYANAEPDEPMFVLLGRDSRAPALVRQWALMETDNTKADEAERCAAEMEEWRAKHEFRKTGFLPGAKETYLRWVRALDLDSDEFVDLGSPVCAVLRSTLMSVANLRAELNAKKSKGE
jgi:hypothetical protein